MTIDQERQRRVFTASGPEIRVLFTGAVHGNEHCGPTAINRLIADIEKGAIVLKHGTLDCIPVCNPPAYIAARRHTGHDMNRNLGGQPHDAYRDALCHALEKADIVLDIHSLYCSLVPFAYLGAPDNTAERDMASSLGVRHFIEGWENAYRNARDSDDQPFEILATQSTGTTEYARQFGARALTLECGRHDDPRAPHVAFRAMLGVLAHAGMIESLSMENRALLEQDTLDEQDIICVRMDSVVYQTKNGTLQSGLQNFDPIHKGQVLAVNEDGSRFLAPHDGFIIMPDDRMTKAPEDPAHIEEWFYTGAASTLRPAI